MARAQDRSGELRLSVSDSSGAGLPAHGSLASQANRFELRFETSPSGEYTARRLPLGSYKLSLEQAGFAPYTVLIEIRSELPLKYSAALAVASITQTVTVRDSDTLLDTVNTGNAYQLGAVTLRDWSASLPGRQAIDVVQAQPGWLLEANGVLHPRGAEYDTQYVVDGLPILNNRSPAFSASEDLEDAQSIKVYTSGIPAEYGRKLGGIIETVTDRNPALGVHGTVVLGGGSFATANGFLGTSYYDGRNVIGFSAEGARTDRFLDPPVVENFTNSATMAGFKGSFERDLSPQDRLRLSANYARSGLLVPNELVQEEAGQRQDRSNKEIGGQVSYQHTFSSNVLGTLQGRVRDVQAELASNPFSTPMEVFQDRGFREGYVSGTIAAALKHHDLKAGADAIFSLVHEKFSYHITNASGFDPSTPLDFDLHESGDDREQAVFFQDNMHFGKFSLSAGLRFDHYRVRVEETAWSPRIGFAWYVPKLGLVLRGSYDRVFGTPAIENLLLSTSAKVRSLNNEVAQLPLRPARGNYFELGATKELFKQAHISANIFRRRLRNFSDDDVLLNTGVSFPIALNSADIYGTESQLTLPQWGPVTAWVSYSYQVASARFPVVGGLFLGSDASEMLNSHDRTWVSQDQRHTVHGQVRYQPWSRFWVAAGAGYGTGLPVELTGEDRATLIEEFGQAVVDRVNLSAGRVKATAMVDVSAAVDVYRKERRSLRLQAEIHNLNDALDVINFASLFSGTAIGAPRSFSVRVRFDY
jgi:hypothetical protein